MSNRVSHVKPPGTAEGASNRVSSVSESASEPAPELDDAAQPPAEGPRALDGVTAFMGLRWEDPQTVHLQIRPELINRGGLLSGVATYAMVDYCMGSALWAQTKSRRAHRDDQHLDQLRPDRDRGRGRLPQRASTGATAGSRCCAARSTTRTAGCW